MSVRTAGDAAEANAALAQAPVVIVVVAADDALRACLTAACAHTPDGVPFLLVAHAARTDVGAVVQAVADEQSGRSFVLLESPSGAASASLGDALRATRDCDVVLLDPRVLVGPQWLTGLRSAARSSNLVATASALIDGEAHLSVLGTEVPRRTLDDAAARVAAASARLRPRLSVPIAGCVYLRRTAVDLVGGVNGDLEADLQEPDLTHRMVAAGLQHVCADEVYVQHRGGTAAPTIRAQRSPEQAAEDSSGALAASRLTARIAVQGMSLAVDGLCLGPDTSGTQVVVLETVRALSARGRFREIVVHVPVSCPQPTRTELAALARVRVVVVSNLSPAPVPLHDVVYRPYQIYDERQLTWLGHLGHRLVVCQLDLIAFHNPTYFPTGRKWADYRALAHRVGASVHGLATISEHVTAEARATGVLRPGSTTKVVYCGTDHLAGAAAAPLRPGAAPCLAPGFLLCLGVGYAHKNRLFALRLLRRLLDDGWEGSLVLAGRVPPHGSTDKAEADLLTAEPDLAHRVVRLGAVTEAEKAWLYRNSALVLYPTSTEGFGLVPFEAAGYGVACLSTRQGALDELLPPGIPVLDDWDVDRAAVLARRLIEDREAAAAVVTAISARAADFTWAGVAERLEDLFAQVVRTPQAALPPGPSLRRVPGRGQVRALMARAVRSLR